MSILLTAIFFFRKMKAKKIFKDSLVRFFSLSINNNIFISSFFHELISVAFFLKNMRHVIMIMSKLCNFLRDFRCLFAFFSISQMNLERFVLTNVMMNCEKCNYIFSLNHVIYLANKFFLITYFRFHFLSR